MGNELEKLQEQEQALAEQTQADLGDDELIIPILKVGQSLTAEVKAHDAEEGDFINSLTGENHGTVVEFIVSGFDRGRFRVENGEVVCTGREGACPCHSVVYEDCPDAEEQWKAAVNRGDKEWGKGPPCATTYNFTGTIPGSEMPVRLSLMKSNAKVAKKLKTMLRFAKAPWDQVFQLETFPTKNAAGYDYHALRIKQARKPTDEERQLAVGLALALRQQAVNFVGDADDEGVAGKKPEREEGINY